MNNLYLGAGCIRVVEHTAYNICKAMSEIFPSHGADAGDFTIRQLEYIQLHLKTEPGHDRLAADLCELICRSQNDHQRVEKSASAFCKYFGGFWAELANASFDTIEKV